MGKSNAVVFCSICFLICWCCLFTVPVAAQPSAEEIAEKIGMDSTNLMVEGTGRKLSVVLAPVSRCTFGDRDALLMELAHSKNHSLLLTVEPLRPIPEVLSFAVRDLTDRKIGSEKFDLELNGFAEGELMFAGLFLCRDTKGEARCRNKVSVDVNSILDVYKVGKEIPLNPIDKIYFFQLLMFWHDRVYFFKQPPLPRALEFLRGEIERQGREAPNGSRSFERLLSTLGSEPLLNLRGKVGLVLPGFDKLRCTGKP